MLESVAEVLKYVSSVKGREDLIVIGQPEGHHNKALT